MTDRIRAEAGHTASLLELAERCERASCPDRELDVAIFLALDMPLPKEFIGLPIALEYNPQQAAFTVPLADMQVRYEPPAYTASIDAAITLVPDGWWLSAHYFSPADFRSEQDREWHAEFGGPITWETFDAMAEPQFECEGGNAATSPLAVTAAALRALSRAQGTAS